MFECNDCSLIIGTCDNYISLIPPFFFLLNKYFKNNIMDIGITAESYEWDGNGLIKRNYVNKGEWSERLVREINKFTSSKYILLLLDDFYIEREINYDVLKKAFELLKNNKKAGVVFFEPALERRTNDSVVNNYFNLIKRGKYTASACPSLWKKDFLLKLLRIKENAWEFEYRGSYRANLSRYRSFCLASNIDNPFYYEHSGIVVQGKIVEDYAERLEKKENILIPRFEPIKVSKYSKKPRKSIFRFAKNRMLLIFSPFAKRKVIN